jgi:HSP20 family protein
MEDYTMLYRSLFSRDLYPRDVFAEIDRLQRELQQSFESSPSIRGQGAFPAINIGTTAQSVEVYAFAPGLKPETIEVNLDRGVLSIAGERASDLPTREEKRSLHINERFSGRFRRVVSLPDDIDPNAVSAEYRDGVLQISIKRREAAQPRRIDIH